MVYSPDYTSYNREINLLNKILPRIRNIILSKNLQIIDLGVGDGIKSARVLSYLNRDFNVSYIGMDMSREMLNIARYNQRNILFNNDYVQCDFNNATQLTETLDQVRNSIARLFLFLGNTITNEVSIRLYLTTLRSILNGSNQRNYLLIGLELLQNNVNKIIREYRNEENYALTIRPLQIIGINKNYGDVSIDFNYDQQRIEEWFLFNRDGEIRTESENIRFQYGDRILLSVTYKPTLTQIRELVGDSGWNEKLILLDKYGGYLLMLLSSDRYHLNHIN